MHTPAIIQNIDKENLSKPFTFYIYSEKGEWMGHPGFGHQPSVVGSQ